jgi:hypothetical protein
VQVATLCTRISSPLETMPPSLPRRHLLFLSISIALAVVGCRRSDQPELGEVTGTVTLGGVPLAGAIVYFSPENRGRVSQAMTDASGKFELVYIGNTMGAKVGNHKVHFTTAYETTDEKTGQLVNRPEVVPSRYRGEATQLTAEVKPGDNTLTFNLDAK